MSIAKHHSSTAALMRDGDWAWPSGTSGLPGSEQEFILSFSRRAQPGRAGRNAADFGSTCRISAHAPLQWRHFSSAGGPLHRPHLGCGWQALSFWPEHAHISLFIRRTNCGGK